MAENQVKSAVAQREEDIQKFWEDRDIFKKSVDKPAPHGDYAFYDGPPFATGLPHYGHILTGIIKDVVPRYKTMCGYRVPRVWGWDCHGLPIENIVEKELGFKHKKDIKEYGIAKFNERCRERVLTYASEWEKIIPRTGRWVDMEHAYRTMDKPYMESVWWVFKQLYDKHLVYEDYRSMYICPRCETTLSQQEVSEGYKDVKDIAVTVKFKIKNPEKHGLPDNTYFLAWTTTPWTLPGNVALAVGPHILYRLYKKGEEYYIVAQERAETLELQVQSLAGLKSPMDMGNDYWIKTGAELAAAGIEYEPPFNYYAYKTLKNGENGWKVYAADFVTASDGTGIAHEAPAFGSDDWELLKKENLPFVQHVNMDGSFKPEVTDFAGMIVRTNSDNDSERLAADIAVLKYLQEHGQLFAKENYTHAYPHCWRCDTPLLNYATTSWFVKILQLKPAMIKTAKAITWSPTHIKEGLFGKWLEGARDWSISRQRFWASVIPVWRCEKCQKTVVFGSAHELELASGTRVDDLHKHIIDEISVPCECGGLMRRVPDVLDTWFDSGSMPYGQKHYPFENKEQFEKTFPAQFISEYTGQFRAWFYYLHVLATALFDKNAFQEVVAHGIVLAEDGKKMSKKLQNYPDPMEVVDKYGADALRLYFLTSPVMQAENLNFSERGVAEWKGVLTKLENVLSFYQNYRADVAHERQGESMHVLDRWILARLQAVQKEITAAMNAYDLTSASRPLALFVDDLSTWYLRRSRERIKGDDATDKKAALATTLFVLHELSKLMAPFAPFIGEYLWQESKQSGDEESVHLAAWPEEPQPPGFLARLFGEKKQKKDTVLEDMAQTRAIVSQALELRDTVKIKVRQPLGVLSIPEKFALTSEYLSLIAEEVNVKKVEKSGDTITLDTALTDELREEGAVRDLMREIQAFRKDSGMKPGDPGVYKLSDDSRQPLAEKYRAEIEKTTNTKLEF